MAEILKIVSHDSINRFLQRERYTPKDLFDFITSHNWIERVGGVVSDDDTVIEKFYSAPKTTELVGYYWSSKHAKAVLGIPLITFHSLLQPWNKNF